LQNRQDEEDDRGETMGDILVAMIAYLVLVQWVLPRLGVPT